MTHRHPFSATLRASLLALLAGTSAAVADDTEIFFVEPTNAQDLKPNVLFIFDTAGSGSGSGFELVPVPFDPLGSYAGPCDENLIYWKRASSGDLGPPVDTSDTATCTVTGNNAAGSGSMLNVNFQCQSARSALLSGGFVATSRTSQWFAASNTNNSRWDKLSRNTSSFVDCQADSLLLPPHGNGVLPYAGNGNNGPYTAQANAAIGWANNATDDYVFFTGKYLNYLKNTPTSTSVTRLELIQHSLKQSLANVTEVNVGLMLYNGPGDGSGGSVVQEVADMALAGSEVLTSIDNFKSGAGTSLEGAMYEAAQYLLGRDMTYGVSPTSTSEIRTDADALLGGTTTYESPIPVAGYCGKTFIVILSSNPPNRNNQVENLTQGLPGFRDTIGTQCNSVTNQTRCTDDIAKYLYESDASGQVGAIQTYTIGFGLDKVNEGWHVDLLRETARVGRGQYYDAGEGASLSAAFTEILQQVIKANTSFTAPTVAVNAFNRTQNLNDLFVAVFSPELTTHWPGNIKKYRIEPDGEILDSQGLPAVDPATGFFVANSRSYWSDINDGPEVIEGGAASKLPSPATRKVYTDIAGSNLTANGNAVTISNSAITAALLGATDTELSINGITRDDLVNWMRGADIQGPDPSQPRLEMGDPLHSRPATVIYGGTEDNPDLVIFASTNDGYLHAIDADTGEEIWSYIPGRLLGDTFALFRNNEVGSNRHYGLDGTIRVLKTDANQNGIVDGTDKVYLYFGMRRGGRAYYALDVTNRSQPSVLWTKDSTSTGFAALGQSWSAPIISRVQIAGATQNAAHLVAIFGGGYDPTQDNAGYSTDSMGNRIYMVDAVSGALLWRAGPTTDSGANLQQTHMTHSIPAEIRVIDLDNNGYADRMYAADMGGKVWRFDIHNNSVANSLVTGGVFASLGAANGNSAGTNGENVRRFYYPPDVALYRGHAGTFLNLAIGSGYRASPLNTTIRDRFYSLRDFNPFTPRTTASYTDDLIVREDDLLDVTTDISPNLSDINAGWMIQLREPATGFRGEKVLSPAVTFQNQILFTSYTPYVGPEAGYACVPRQGLNRQYAVNLLDGSPTTNRDGSTGPDGQVSEDPDSPADRFSDLAQSGIAPEAVVLFPGTSTPTCIVGVEQCGVNFTNDPVKTFWAQQDVDTN